MWESLWPTAEILGIDLEFSRFFDHLPALREKGANLADVELVQWDAYSRIAPEGLKPFDLVIDDGPHTDGTDAGLGDT